MRDLDFTEMKHVYGASGSGCSPTPPSCTTSKGSKAKNTMSKATMSKGSKTKSGKSQSYGCYC